MTTRPARTSSTQVPQRLRERPLAVHRHHNADDPTLAARQLLGLIRRHWRVETNHQIRDVTRRKDHQHAYIATGAQVTAMIRNLALAILRLTGQQEITRTLQRIAADRTLIPPILAAFPLPAPA